MTAEQWAFTLGPALLALLAGTLGWLGARWLRRSQLGPAKPEVVRISMADRRCYLCDHPFRDGDLALQTPGCPLVHTGCVVHGSPDEMEALDTTPGPWGVWMTLTHWYSENGGDDVVGTRAEMAALAAECEAALKDPQHQSVRYEARPYRPRADLESHTSEKNALGLSPGVPEKKA